MAQKFSTIRGLLAAAAAPVGATEKGREAIRVGLAQFGLAAIVRVQHEVNLVLKDSQRVGNTVWLWPDSVFNLPEGRVYAVTFGRDGEKLYAFLEDGEGHSPFPSGLETEVLDAFIEAKCITLIAGSLDPPDEP